jgi:hypothetical protein
MKTNEPEIPGVTTASKGHILREVLEIAKQGGTQEEKVARMAALINRNANSNGTSSEPPETESPSERFDEYGVVDVDESETPLDSQRFKTAVKPVIIGVVFIFAVLLIGWLLVGYVRESNIEEAKTSDLEAQKLQRRNETQTNLRNQGLESYRNLVASEFQGWEIMGDDLDVDSLGFETNILVTSHIRNENTSMVVNIVLHLIKSTGGNSDERNAYWIAYRPTAIQLANIEIESVKRTEFESGQENP